jgi:hypothetical protein
MSKGTGTTCISQSPHVPGNGLVKIVNQRGDASATEPTRRIDKTSG